MLGRITLFLKHHWKIPAIVFLILVCAFLYRSKLAGLIGVLHQSRGDYKRALEETNEKNKKAIADIGRNAIANLEQQELRQAKLDKEITKLEAEKEELEEELEEDLERLAQEIKDKF